MISGDCNVCINGKLSPYSATCVECGLSRKNFKPTTNGDRIRSMDDEELAKFLSVQMLAEVVRGWKSWLKWLREEAPHD
jgi:hypothetical protein